MWAWKAPAAVLSYLIVLLPLGYSTLQITPAN